jgi:hypothetical protein
MIISTDPIMSALIQVIKRQAKRKRMSEMVAPDDIVVNEEQTAVTIKTRHCCQVLPYDFQEIDVQEGFYYLYISSYTTFVVVFLYHDARSPDDGYWCRGGFFLE